MCAYSEIRTQTHTHTSTQDNDNGKQQQRRQAILYFCFCCYICSFSLIFAISMLVKCKRKWLVCSILSAFISLVIASFNVIMQYGTAFHI